eukprot:1946705-Amphidinium_carterae.1
MAMNGFCYCSGLGLVAVGAWYGSCAASPPPCGRRRVDPSKSDGKAVIDLMCGAKEQAVHLELQ